MIRATFAGLQIVNPEFFNSMTTLHGLIMVFG
jgi:heme/copper-type cytochrome/quinol oxidase subunit 1